MDRADEDIRQALRQRHRLHPSQDDDFFTRDLAEVEAMRDASSRTLTALLVGGIGVMNIMLVSVSERTAEIGVRLAIGARPRDVERQFLVEAVLLTGIGGLLGAATGIAAAVAAGALAGWPVVVEPAGVLLALGASVAVGVFFGFYPARRAALLDPVVALRRG
jgi:putative ABC transport system permease protein